MGSPFLLHCPGVYGQYIPKTFTILSLSLRGSDIDSNSFLVRAFIVVCRTDRFRSHKRPRAALPSLQNGKT